MNKFIWAAPACVIFGPFFASNILGVYPKSERITALPGALLLMIGLLIMLDCIVKQYGLIHHLQRELEVIRTIQNRDKQLAEKKGIEKAEAGQESLSGLE